MAHPGMPLAIQWSCINVNEEFPSNSHIKQQRIRAIPSHSCHSVLQIVYFESIN